MFNKNSVLVKVWVSLVMGGEYTVEQVPNISNLQDMVKSVLYDMGYTAPTTPTTPTGTV